MKGIIGFSGTFSFPFDSVIFSGVILYLIFTTKAH
jgi:hypothetical protein